MYRDDLAAAVARAEAAEKRVAELEAGLPKPKPQSFWDGFWAFARLHTVRPIAIMVFAQTYAQTRQHWYTELPSYLAVMVALEFAHRGFKLDGK